MIFMPNFLANTYNSAKSSLSNGFATGEADT